MNPRRLFLGGSVLLLSITICAGQRASAQSATAPPAPSPPTQDQIARIAEIEIDPQQIEPYKAALREGIAAAIRLEPGVLSLYAVSIKGHPDQVRVFELYASQAAYQAHLQTPHFLKYKAATKGMVRSLTLLETDPIALGRRTRH